MQKSGVVCYSSVTETGGRRQAAERSIICFQDQLQRRRVGPEWCHLDPLALRSPTPQLLLSPLNTTALSSCSGQRCFFQSGKGTHSGGARRQQERTRRQTNTTLSSSSDGDALRHSIGGNKLQQLLQKTKRSPLPSSSPSSPAATDLGAESVQGLASALEGVDDVEGGDGLPLGVLGVGDGVTDHVWGRRHVSSRPSRSNNNSVQTHSRGRS